MSQQEKMYRLGLYEKAMPSDLTFAERLGLCKAKGFDYLEISIDETDERLARLDWSDEELGRLRDTIAEEGVPILSMCLSGHRRYPLGSPDPEKRAKGLEIMEKAVDFSRKLGIRIIQLAGYDTYYDEGNEETKAYFQENLVKATQMAAKSGIILGFETMETSFMDTVAKAMTYVDDVRSPYLGVYPDIGNLQNAAVLYGHDVVEDIETGRGHIFAAHLKETIPGHYREIAFGTGHTRYEDSIGSLWNQGVRLYVGEFWYKGSENWQEDLAFASSFLREKIERVIEEC